MSIFIEKTLDNIINNYNIKNIIFVVPNTKYIYTILSVYRKKINKNILLYKPKIYTLLEIMEIISGIYLIEKNLLEIYFYEILKKKISKDYFIKFIEKNIVNILSDFNNIDINLINTNIFFKNIISYDKIDIYSYTNIFKNKSDENFSFWKIIMQCYDELKDKLLNKKMAYRGLIFRESYKNINQFIKRNSNIEKFIFIGIISNSNSELYFIKKLLSINKAKLYLDIDKYYYNNIINTSGIFIKKILLNLKFIKNIKWIFDDFSKKKEIKIIGSQGQISQLKVVNDIIKNIKIYKLHRTVIIIPDNNINIIPIIYSINNKLLDLNIHLTFYLKISSLRYSFSIFFKLFYNRKLKNLNGFFINDIISLFNDSFFKTLLNNIEEIDIIRSYDNNIISDKEVRIIFKQNEIIEILNPKNIITYNLLSILNFISKKMKKFLLKNNNKKYESYIDIIFINEFNNWIKKNKLLIKNNLNISIEKLFFLYKNWIQISQGIININNKKSISVMDIFNASLITFDNVIIISANEGSFPPYKDYKNSFIPYNISEKFKIYNKKENNYIYAYHFYLLIQRCKKLFFIYDNNPKGVFLGEKSRFIHQIMHESMHKIDIIDNYNNKININNNNTISIVFIKKNNLIMKKINHFFLYKGISPSSINLYINDPIEFFLYKILCLKKNNHELNQLGIIVHKILESLYKEYIGHKLNIYIIEKILSSLDDNVVKYLKKININNINNIYFIDTIIVKEYIKKIILWDKKSIIDGNDIIIKKIEYNLSFFYEKQKIKIIGIIDRIDLFNGSIRIIDYKTGIVDKKFLKINSKNNFKELLNNHLYNKSLQLMIYAKLLLFNNNNIEFVYPIIFSLKEINHLIVNNNIGISFNNIKIFSSVLIFKLQEINNPNIPFIGKK